MAHSVFSLLRLTMPLGIGVAAARRAARLSESAVLSPAQLFPYVRPLGKSADLRPPAPSAPSPPSGAAENLAAWWDSTTASQRLWSFQHTGATPSSFTSVTARVRDTGYKTHSVLTSIDLGRLNGTSVSPEVRIVTEAGATLDLPLTLDYVHSKFHVTGGWVGENALLFHPLAAYLDHGIVIAFAYEIGGGNVRPYVPSPTDPSEQALSDYLSSGASASDPENDRWLDRMCSGDFMPSEVAPTMTTSGGTRGVSVFPPRVIIAVTLATLRERADFEPGGIVGMGRIYPHVMVRSNVRLKRIETAAKFTRPARTTTLDTGNGTVPGTSCNAYADIKSLLVADSNEDPWGVNDAFKPFWSGVFAYYEVDPDVRLGGTPLHVVRRDRSSTRTEASCGHRDLASSPETFTSIEKRPRQGEFDNIHIAPRLRLDAAFVTYRAAIAWPPGSRQYDAISPSSMRLDQLAMAPFCSHDCLHMHWRWSPGGPRWTKGWGSGVAPYSEVAVPMIPTNHDLDLICNGPNTVTLVEKAYPSSTPGEDDTGALEADRFEIFFYPGAAYAQGIVSWRESVGASMVAWGANGRTGFSSWDFADASRTLMDITQPSVLYWNLRYYACQVGTTWTATPWIGSYSAPTSDITTAEVDRARHA
ncbi:hypothetical protein [Sorangium sp. So ce426]|uniref:hypothetical protein n=1 Tax=Sorangium sp. So ce426 TaxID=3133312 RepID=UPI003F5AED42